MQTTKSKRRRWQFEVRDLLWLMIITALAAGWWMRERRFQQDRARLQGALREVREVTDVYRQLGAEMGGFTRNVIDGDYAWQIDDDGHAAQVPPTPRVDPGGS